MLKGGGTKCFEVVLTWELDVLAIVMGGGGRRKRFFCCWGGGEQNVLLCLEEGAGTQNVSDPRFSHFVAPPPLPIIDDQSLSSKKSNVAGAGMGVSTGRL